jgi:hypothetical protein
MHSIRVAAFVPLLAGVMVACASQDGTSAEDHGVSAVQFQDVVVPSGMNIHDRNHESHSREESGWRFGHFVYTGQTRVEEACSHLLLRMPQHSWRLVSDEQADPVTRRLRFVRGRYVAEYVLKRQDGITEMVIDYRTQIEDR